MIAVTLLVLSAAANAAQAGDAPREMTTVGWIFMLASNVFVWGLTLWCFKRVLTTPGEPTDPGPAAKP